MKSVYTVLQVRVNSKRLPRKLLLPLNGLSIFEHILIRLLQAKETAGVIVATTQNTLPWINDINRRYGIKVFAGDEDDVLGRYVKAIEMYNIGTVVRATGDNPLVSTDYLDRTVRLHLNSDADLTTFPDLPLGTGVEVISAKLLVEADRMGKKPYEREHITQYIYSNESRYKVLRGIPEKKFNRPDLRLTVDTEEDYRKMLQIYKALYRGRPIELKEVIEYLDSLR